MADSNHTAGSEKCLPLRLGHVDEFRQALSLFRMSHFDESTICRLLKLARISDFDPKQPHAAEIASIEPAVLQMLIRLFLYQEVLAREPLEQCISPPVLDAFLSLDLLRHELLTMQGETTGMFYYSPVFLSPIGEMLVASDRNINPNGSPFVPSADFVFPAISQGTIDFLRILPKSPAAEVLELGSGTGIAAFYLSRYCGRVVASDITSRSTHFARFNALLNQCSNVEVLQGDLYSSLENQTFDRIVTHPPYMPVHSQTLICRDGGRTGETILQGIIEGLSKHLRPGGEFYCLSMGLDTANGRFEERALDWLGVAHDQFEVLFALADERTPSVFAANIAPPAAAKELEEIYRTQEVQRVAYGPLVLRRKASAAAKSPANEFWPRAMRVGFSPATDGSCFERIFTWRRWLEDRDAAESISRLKPKLAPGLQLKTLHEVRDTALVPKEFLIETEFPFPKVLKVDPWIVAMIASFDGMVTPADWHAGTVENSALQGPISLSRTLEIVAYLIEHGYLEVQI
jgi:methylase of polypeptide subunit release factors